MKLLRNLFGRAERDVTTDESFEKAADEACLAAASALVVALERRGDELDLAAHCARVALVADRIAALLEVDPSLRAVLRHAALLHEVGMIGVPHDLLEGSRTLSAEELERVRAQAELSAEVARATCGPLAATVIRHQYDDYATLRERLGDDGTALLLAGILRTADVAEAITHPRPYQDPLPPSTRRQLLAAGAGVRFDPTVVRAYLSAAT